MRSSVAVAVAVAVALFAAVSVNAQFLTVPFGGPRKVRPSPNGSLPGSPAGIAAAIATKGRPVAMSDLDASRRPEMVLQFLGLPLGARVLDVGAGDGYYSEIIGGAIGSGGRVTALVLPLTMQDPVRRAAISGVVGRVPNVSILAVSPAKVRFAANSFDFVLMHLAYHALYATNVPSGHGQMDPAAFLREVYAALRPGGIVGVVDHVASPGGTTRDTVEQLHRIDPATVRTDFRRAGFVLDGESPMLGNADDDHGSAASDADIVDDSDRFIFRFRKPE